MKRGISDRGINRISQMMNNEKEMLDAADNLRNEIKYRVRYVTSEEDIHEKSYMVDQLKHAFEACLETLEQYFELE